MKITDNKVCYYCGKKAVSSEHVPPKCFFPKECRKNLIQVPSCEDHNEQTSKDDSYVLIVISSFYWNNETGKNHSITKGIQPLLRSKALQTVIKENSLPVFVDNGDGIQKTTMFEVDRPRFDGELIKMAKALFFHTYEKQWNKQLFVGTPSLIYHDGLTDELGSFINGIKSYLEKNGFDQDNPFKGDNPNVFKYRFMEAEDPDTPILQMIFYDGFEVWVFVDTSAGSC